MKGAVFPGFFSALFSRLVLLSSPLLVEKLYAMNSVGFFLKIFLSKKE